MYCICVQQTSMGQQLVTHHHHNQPSQCRYLYWRATSVRNCKPNLSDTDTTYYGQILTEIEVGTPFDANIDML